jgi:hypothetical protein
MAITRCHVWTSSLRSFLIRLDHFRREDNAQVVPASLLVSKISACIHTAYLDIPYGCYTQYLLFPRTTLTGCFFKMAAAPFGVRH